MNNIKFAFKDEMKKKLRKEYDRLKVVADDEAVDEGIRNFGRRAVALENHIEQLRKGLQQEIQQVTTL